jgi:6-phosphogluconolactonase (cycloisomerase 2 family)
MNRITWLAGVLACAGCAQLDSAHDTQDVAAASDALRLAQKRGAVFTTGNEVDGNDVVAFPRDRHGMLGAPIAYATGGKGTGDSLASQSALVLTEDHRFLIAVNAGSDDVSSFAVDGAELTRVDRAASRGVRPVSVTARHGLVYVLNAGEPANVSGFALDRRGRLLPLPHATRALTGTGLGAAQVELTPDARTLVVTEKAANAIETFRVGALGRLDAPIVNASAGTTPYGFEFTRDGHLIVSEAASASLSSYAVRPRSGLSLQSGAVPDTQAAPCWVAISGDDRWAFTSNAGSGSISSYEIGRRGTLELADPRAGELEEGGAPLDMALDQNGRFLYVLDRGNAGVTAFDVGRDGELDLLDAAGGLPPFATGLAAY